MNYSLSTSYTLKWQLKTANEYKFSECGKCINVQRGKQIKQVLNGGCIGYCIRGKFQSLTSLRPLLEKITDVDCPF